MATATEFPQANKVFTAPPGMRDCSDLPTYVGHTPLSDGTPAPVIISCWELTPEELEEINRTGKLYLWVFGQAQPPIAVSGNAPDFTEVNTQGDGGFGLPETP